MKIKPNIVYKALISNINIQYGWSFVIHRSRSYFKKVSYVLVCFGVGRGGSNKVFPCDTKKDVSKLLRGLKVELDTEWALKNISYHQSKIDKVKKLYNV